MVTTAWVLPGGASMGAVQAGQASALLAAGAAPDLLVGTSAGALNAAHLAADPTPAGSARLEDLWRSVRRADVFPLRPVSVALGLAGRRDHLVPSLPLRGWLEAHLPYRRLEEGRLPLTVTATDLATGEAVHLSSGPLIPSLLASCAIPGVFAPVELGGRLLVDGGLAVASSIELAASAGADRVIVLPTLGPAPSRPPRGPGGVLLRSVNVMLGRIRESAATPWTDQVAVFVAPAPQVEGASPFSFAHTSRLIDAGRELTAAWWPSARPLAASRPGDLRPA